MADDKRRDERVPVELNLQLAFGSVDEFIDRYALNISRGGIFVRTRDPQPAGALVRFAVELESGVQVIKGTAVVRWTTPPSAPGEPPRPPGMGLKFTELDPESRALVDLVVASRGPGGATDEPPRPPDAAVEELEPLDDDDVDVEDGGDAASAAAAAAPVAPTASVRRNASAPAQPPARPAPPTAAPAQTLPRPAAGPPRPGSAARAAPAPQPPPAPAQRPPDPAARPAAPARPSAPARSKKVVGIDLGTTNSCVAFAEGGKARVLASRQGYTTIPSVVAYDAQGRLLVGHPAKAQMVINPRNTVYGAKRLVGRRFSSPTVQACRDRFHYEIVEGREGAAAVRFAGREFSLQQVSAFILAEMKAMASEALSEEVTRAVVTVPAYYNDHQRQAVREAGLLAGLQVERIVNEPTAAALAFGYGRGLEKRVLVYDLGGGTFDASVLDIQGDIYEVVSTGGDTFLGGLDFDAQLMDHLVYAFMEQHGFAPPDDRVLWQRIRDAAEEIKVALSGRDAAVGHVPYLCKDRAGRDVELKVEVTRAELEALTAKLVDRTAEVCREVLAAKGLGPGDIAEVLLVGGQSRMPLVWKRIRDELGREPNKSVHPDEAVAIGAALLADSGSRIDSVVLIDVLAMTIGVGLPGGRMAPVLHRNSKLPARKSYELATTRDGQTELELQVFQGDSAKVSECEYLGTVQVPNLPPRPRGSVKVAVDFALGAEGILAVTARDLASGQVSEVKLATLDTPASLKEKLQLSEAATAPRGARPLDGVPPPGVVAAAKKGLLGRLFGRR